MAAEDPLLSVPELARRLGVSTSTIRNWRAAYGDLIRSEVGPDGVRRHPVGPYELVAALRARDLPPAAIRATLERDEGAPTRPVGATERIALALERMAPDLTRIADALERLADRQGQAS